MSKRKKSEAGAISPSSRATPAGPAPAGPGRVWRVAVPLLLAVAVIVVFANKPGREPASSVPAPASTAALTPASAPAPAPAPDPVSAPAPSPLSSHADPGTAAPRAGIPRLVDLGADKCIPCKAMAPILVELRAEYAGRMQVDFIDVWKNPGAGEPYRTYAIPTQIFFDGSGKELTRHEGFISKADILATWKRHGFDFSAAGAAPKS